MKYVITGSAGNVSKPLAEKLIKEGHEVIVIGRDAQHLKALTDQGAKAAVGSIEDLEFLKKTFAGANAVYLMFPPQYGGSDFKDYVRAASIYAEAIRASNIKYVVVLSSVGAHLAEGCGPVSGLYLAEQELRKLTETNILFLRPGFFYINLYGNIGMIKHMNILGGNFGNSEARMILSHPNDVAEVAAEILESLSFKGHSVQYLASDIPTTGAIAKALGTAIGNPNLPWVEFSDEQAYEGMKQAGLPELLSKRYAEMGSAMRSGKMWEDFPKHQPKEFGKTKLEDFAKEFAVVYNAS